MLRYFVHHAPPYFRDNAVTESTARFVYVPKRGYNNNSLPRTETELRTVAFAIRTRAGVRRPPIIFKVNDVLNLIQFFL